MSRDTPYCRECKQHVSTAGGLLTDSFFVCAECLRKEPSRVREKVGRPAEEVVGTRYHCDICKEWKLANGAEYHGEKFICAGCKCLARCTGMTPDRKHQCSLYATHDGEHSFPSLTGICGQPFDGSRDRCARDAGHSGGHVSYVSAGEHGYVLTEPRVAATCDEPLKIAPGGKCTFPLKHSGPHSWAAQCGEPHIWRSKDQSPIALCCQKPLGHADLHSSEHERVGRVQWIPAVEGPAQSEWGYAFRAPAERCSHHPQCMLPKDHVGLCTASSAPVYPVSTEPPSVQKGMCLQTYHWPSEDGSPGKAAPCIKSEGHAGAHAFNMPGAGQKFDAGKMDWSLLPWDGLESVVRVLEYGAQKYSRDNWRKVPDSTTRYRKALLRHVIAWCSGIEVDEETGESHLAHAVCCAIFILGKRETP